MFRDWYQLFKYWEFLKFYSCIGASTHNCTLKQKEPWNSLLYDSIIILMDFLHTLERVAHLSSLQNTGLADGKRESVQEKRIIMKACQVMMS